MKIFLPAMIALLMAPSAFAQGFGALLGVHQTDADTSVSGSSIDGKFNFKAGLAVTFDLMENSRFRTGVLFNRRHMEEKTALGKFDLKFDYIDIPANFQYNVNELFGLFGGLVIAANVNDDVEGPAGVMAQDPDVEELIPLLNLGVAMTFEDMIGFDVYYERGMGDVADGVETYSTFGANFIYWF